MALRAVITCLLLLLSPALSFYGTRLALSANRHVIDCGCCSTVIRHGPYRPSHLQVAADAYGKTVLAKD